MANYLDVIDHRRNVHVGCPKFDGPPDWHDCRKLIADLAHAKYVGSGKTMSADRCWLEAERVLFGNSEGGKAYRVFVRDDSKGLIEDFYHHWYVLLVREHGSEIVTT